MRYCKFLLLIPLIFALRSFSACGNTQPPDETCPPYEDTADIEDIAVDEPVVKLPASDATEAIEPPFEGKIAIVTGYFAGSIDYYSTYPLIDKYGDKVVHAMWAYDGSNDINTLLDLVSDLEIKALIVYPSFDNTNGKLEELRMLRKDIFVAYIVDAFYDIESSCAQTADLLLMTDWHNTGSTMAEQANKLGAETFVHYFYLPVMSSPRNIKRYDLLKNKCAELGLEFVNINTPEDCTEQFILDDVPKMVEKYGVNTAFFSPSPSVQAQLIEAVLDAGAIYPSSCHPYPFYGYPSISFDYLMETARSEYFDLGYEDLLYKDDFNKCIEIGIAKVRADLEGKGDLSRLSTWPVFDDFMYASTAAEYAIKWINGEVPKEGVDVAVLTQLMEEYAGVNVYLTPFVDDGTHDYYKREGKPTGETYENFLLMRMDYVTFEELGVKK
jgi:hypothetical protein